MAGFFKRNILDKAMILGAVICIVITAFTAFAEDCEEKPQEVLINLSGLAHIAIARP